VVNPERTDKSPEDATTEKEIVDMFNKQGKSKFRE
jgi:hypothetical protein